MSEHNYRIISNKPLRIYDYFKTQQELDAVIERRANRRHTAEFYQPGIGWVKYNPQPVDYAAIIRRLVESGDKLNSELKFYATTRGFTESVYDELASWLEVRNSAEVKKALGEA